MARSRHALKNVATLLVLCSTELAFANLRFRQACEPARDTFTIAAVGDILIHSRLAKQAYSSPQGFESLWPELLANFRAADMVYGNLEGPTAPGVPRVASKPLTRDPGPVLDGNVYTGDGLNFNYHPRLIGDLQRSGFTVLSTANNHALDRRAVGVDLTIDALESYGMPFFGTRRSGDRSARWHRITRKNGWSIAWLGCTQMNNGNPDPQSQLLYCFKPHDKQILINEIRELAADPSIDAVLVTPHWGEEYQKANKQQKHLARELLEAGASAIIGSHPHVLQDVEKYLTSDGRETLIAYSLGNFVSDQTGKLERRTSMILNLGLSRSAGKKAWINGVSYLPIFMDTSPMKAVPLAQSRQADRAAATAVVNRVIDPSRKLEPHQRPETRLECAL